MTVRCTICSAFILYDEKKDKMMGLVKCSCGGHTELMKPSGKLQGEHPVYPEKTCKSILYTTPYYYAYKNDKGDYFVWKDDKLVRVENPVEAVLNPINQ